VWRSSFVDHSSMSCTSRYNAMYYCISVVQYSAVATVCAGCAWHNHCRACAGLPSNNPSLCPACARHSCLRAASDEVNVVAGNIILSQLDSLTATCWSCSVSHINVNTTTYSVTHTADSVTTPAEKPHRVPPLLVGSVHRQLQEVPMCSVR
jgi:hypothetical protein